MNAIDVLAVLAALNLASPDQRTSLNRTRAAVAELIEAADQAHAFLCEEAPATATEFRLRTALARCKGGAA